ncbi:MAG: ImmA/IrrE family metallo-endopeptidase [Burkholderiales bacterium]|nr:ImmA/IrrE family metallo-endopeptidase [Burkholderiales bacterium]
MQATTTQDIRKHLKSVDSIAENLLLNLFGIVSLPINIDDVITKLRVNCEIQQLPESVSGAIKIQNNRASMVINVNHSKVRQRFTKAHEIGHLVAHILTNSNKEGFVDHDLDAVLIQKNRDNNSAKGRDPEEIFANKFAAAILIPRTKLIEYLRDERYANNIQLLADIFDVSKAAMEFRIKTIGN